MQKLILFLVTIISCVVGAGVNLKQVRSVAQGFIIRNANISVGQRIRVNRVDPLNISKVDGTTAYVDNLDPVGFIIISGDQDLPPVIAYSMRTNFVKKDNFKFSLIEDIRIKTVGGEKYFPEFALEIHDEGGEAVARVKKVIYIRKKKK